MIMILTMIAGLFWMALADGIGLTPANPLYWLGFAIVVLAAGRAAAGMTINHKRRP